MSVGISVVAISFWVSGRAGSAKGSTRAVVVRALSVGVKRAAVVPAMTSQEGAPSARKNSMLRWDIPSCTCMYRSDGRTHVDR